MERLRENAPVLVVALLSLLLLAYVFTGGTSKEKPDRLARCASSQAYDLVKGGLFRQAAALRGSNDPSFQQLAGYSIVRPESQIRRKSNRSSGTVTCSGTIALDLPPGVEVVGGRRSLNANLEYVLRGNQGGPLQLASLTDANAITVPLATVGRVGSQTGQPLAPAPAAQDQMDQNDPLSRQAEPSVPPPARVVQSDRPAPKPTPPKATPRPEPRVVASKPVQKPRRRATATATQSRPPQPAVRTTTPAVAASSVRPSFNCRYARRYGEVAACSNPALASLDRQMAGQFHRAMAGASPGAKVMLERSRNRFLRSRDACRSHACVAAAYRQRMSEISSIMSGGF